MRKLTLCAALCLAACGGGSKDTGARTTTPETTAAQQPPSTEAQTTGAPYAEPEAPPPPMGAETMPTPPPQPPAAQPAMPPSPTPTTGATTTTGGAMTNLNDEQILAIMNASDAAEIQQAQLVKDRTQNAQVRKFAEKMIREHGQMKADGQKLVTKLKVTPQDNQMSLQLTSDSKQLVDTLRGEKGAQFDKDYIDAQVKQHRDLLDTLDNKLIPQAKAPELKTELQNTRTRVEAHLKVAEDIQKNLGNKP